MLMEYLHCKREFLMSVLESVGSLILLSFARVIFLGRHVLLELGMSNGDPVVVAVILT